MNKVLSLLAAATLIPLQGLAEGPIDGKIYGKINVSVVYDDNDSDDITEINSNASRLGFKGKTELSDGLNAIYQLEYETYPDDGDKSGRTFSQRNIYAGLSGKSWGSLIIGKHDSPTKISQKKVDLFNDLEGDIKHLLEGETRASNMLMYTTPKAGGFSAKVQLVQGESRSDGDRDTLFDIFSASFNWQVNKNLYFALGIDSNMPNGSWGKGIDDYGLSKIKYVDIARLVAQYKIGAVQLGAIYQQADDGDSTAAEYDADGYLLSAKWSVNKKFALKAQYGSNEDDESELEKDALSLGFDYKLGKKSKIFAFYTDEDVDIELLGSNVTLEDNSFFGIGFEHKF